MSIDWNHLTPGNALGGGLLIGLSAALLLILNGRIAGVSGIVGSLLRFPRGHELRWRLAFVAGLIAAPVLYGFVGTLPRTEVQAGWLQLILAGLLVGLGARLGSGCTSGHGICGLSRLSPRSVVATLTFMGTGFLTVFICRHLLV